MISQIAGVIASFTAGEVITRSLGKPLTQSIPMIFLASFVSFSRFARDTFNLPAVRSLIEKLSFLRIVVRISCVRRSPPTGITLLMITRVSAITEISVVAAPMFTIMDPLVRMIGMPSASASAIGRSTRSTLLCLSCPVWAIL